MKPYSLLAVREDCEPLNYIRAFEWWLMRSGSCLNELNCYFLLLTIDMFNFYFCIFFFYTFPCLFVKRLCDKLDIASPGVSWVLMVSIYVFEGISCVYSFLLRLSVSGMFDLVLRSALRYFSYF